MGYSPRIMDALVLALWAQENASVLEGLTIHDATVIRDWRFGLDLGREWLTVSLEPSFLAVFSETRPPGRPAGGLPATLTNAMVGARITGLETIAGERILRLVTDRGTLVIELLPASPALVWVSEEGQEGLRAFLEKIPGRMIGVNYDPANLVMRGFDQIGGVAMLATKLQQFFDVAGKGKDLAEQV